MCGIVGVVSHGPVNQIIYDALLLLQHRGQDAAGIATSHGNTFSMHKANGLVRDVFRTRNMRSLPGNSDCRLVERRRSAALLCECAIWHHARAQRESD
jgi:glutamine phosphoribosylpyrophosphate amidotransferase